MHTQDLCATVSPPEESDLDPQSHRWWAQSPRGSSRVWRPAWILLAGPVESAFIFGKC